MLLYGKMALGGEVDQVRLKALSMLCVLHAGKYLSNLDQIAEGLTFL